MLDNIFTREQTGPQTRASPVVFRSRGNVVRLLDKLKEAGMLDRDFTLPANWKLPADATPGALAAAIRQRLTSTGWHLIVEVMRAHNRQHPEMPWDLSHTGDFLAAVDEALQRSLPRDQRSKMWANGDGLDLSPAGLYAKLAAQTRRVRAEAQRESALSRTTLYAARMEGRQIERQEALAQVDKMRDQLQRQLQVFCREQGIPMPAPCSREEAYCLHLLAAYFSSLTGAEKSIARRASILAKRQIALEGKLAEATVNGRIVPDLLRSLGQINPLREGLLREQTRHTVTLTVGALASLFAGCFWGLVEGVSEASIAGVSRYAPVVAPALLVGLATLAARTIVQGLPLNLEALAHYLAHALWNGGLTFGATLVVYGCWQYFQNRYWLARGLTQQATAREEENRGVKAPNDLA